MTGEDFGATWFDSTGDGRVRMARSEVKRVVVGDLVFVGLENGDIRIVRRQPVVDLDGRKTDTYAEQLIAEIAERAWVRIVCGVSEHAAAEGSEAFYAAGRYHRGQLAGQAEGST